MERCDFSAVMGILRSYISEDCGLGQIDLLYELFSSFMNAPEAKEYYFDNGLVCRWMNGQAKISPQIVRFYMGLFKKNKLTADIKEKILPLLYDSGMAEEKLYALVAQDTTISEKKKRELLRRWPCKDEAMEAAFLAGILLFAMERNFVKRDPKTKLLMAKGELSPVVRDYLLNGEVPAPCRHFCGRDHELEALHELLNAHGKVFVQGIPGIGKSELVKAYAKKHKKEMTNVVYLTYTGSLQSDIQNLDFADDFPGEGETERLMKHHRFLRTLREDSLLIVDNFDTTAEKDSFLPAVLRYRMKVIFTTRSRFDDAAVLNLAEMEDEESLFQLASKLHAGAEKDREIVQEIIRTVHGHTLAVELAARLLETGLLEPAVILKKLQEERAGMDAADTIGITKDGTKKKATYYEHIRTLFGLYKLAEAEQNVLRGLTLAPLAGLDMRLFAGWMHLNDLNLFNDLVEKGFVQKKPGRLAALHPMIREVAIEETKPDITNCRTIMESIRAICLRHGEEIPYATLLFDVIENIMTVCQKNDWPSYILFLEDALEYMEKYGEHARMEKVFQELAGGIESEKVSDPKDCILAYDHFSMCEEDPEQALIWSQRAAELSDDQEEKHPLLTSNMHANLGTRYGMMGLYPEAKVEMEIGMEILKKYDLVSSHDSIAQLVNYAMLLAHMEQPDEALHILEHTTPFVIENQNEWSLDAGACEEAHGHILMMKGEGTEAAKHYAKMIQIYELHYKNQPEILREKKEQVVSYYMQTGLMPPRMLMEKFS